MNPKIEIGSKEELYALKVVKSLFPSFCETECRGDEDRGDVDGYISPFSVQVKYDGRMSETGNLYLQLSYQEYPWTPWIEVKFLANIRIHVCQSFLIWVPTPHLLKVSKKRHKINSPLDSVGKPIPIASLAPNYRLLKHSIPFD